MAFSLNGPHPCAVSIGRSFDLQSCSICRHRDTTTSMVRQYVCPKIFQISDGESVPVCIVYYSNISHFLDIYCACITLTTSNVTSYIVNNSEVRYSCLYYQNQMYSWCTEEMNMAFPKYPNIYKTDCVCIHDQMPQF